MRFVKPEYKLPTAGAFPGNTGGAGLVFGEQLGQGEPVDADPARQFHGAGRSLPAQQCFRGEEALVAGLLAADGGGGLGDDPEPYGRGQVAQGFLREADSGSVSLLQPGEGVVCHVFEVVGVQLQDGRRPGEGLRDAGAQLFLEQGQHFNPGPGPGERGIGVARIVPGLQVLGRADLQGVGAAQAQEGPQQASADGPHPGQGAGAGAAGESQQDLFGLVIERMSEQDHTRAGLFGCLLEGGVAGVPGGRFRAHARGGDVHGPDLDRRKSQPAQDFGGAGGHLGGAGLQLVVHHHRAD